MFQSCLAKIAAGLLVATAVSAQAAVVSVSVAGTGLPAIPYEINAVPFGSGSKCILDRNTVALAASFDATNGRLLNGGVPSGTFPSYLVGGESVMLAQGLRSIVDLSVTITVDQPSDVYLLIDNRCDGIIGNSPTDSEYDDPFIFGTIQWISDDGWTRVSTGLSPDYTGGASVPAAAGPQSDYLGIDEGANGSLNQFYAIYKKSTSDTITLGAQAEGNNMYHVVVTPEPASLGLLALAGAGLLARRRR